MHLDMRYKYSAYCAQCRLMFENGEDMFSWEGEYVCSDCFDALFSELDRYERAGLVGSRVINYRRPYGTPVS